MKPIERFWLDVIEGRKYWIQTIYGTEAMNRYQPHDIEREYFIANNGHFSNHPAVIAHNKSFIEYCEIHHKTEKARYLRNIKANQLKYEASPLYQSLKLERQELIDYIRGITVRDANEEEANTRTTQKESR